MPFVFPPICVKKAPHGWLVPLDVRVRCAVPDKKIQDHIRYNINHGFPEIGVRQAHHDRMVIVASGPSLLDTWSFLKDLNDHPNHKTLCVKSSHDFLIDRGIVPDFCILLDGREHVKEMFKPHPEVTYLVASMCAESTLEYLKSQKCNIVVWHAAVGANEKEVIKRKHVIIGGGSTSPLRAMPLGATMGFRSFMFFGLDSSYDAQGRKVHFYLDTKKQDGTERAVQVVSAGKKFLTTPEMIGQAQDFEALLTHPNTPRIEIYMVGDGLNKHRFDNRVYFPTDQFEMNNKPFYSAYQQNLVKQTNKPDREEMEKKKEREYDPNPLKPGVGRFREAA